MRALLLAALLPSPLLAQGADVTASDPASVAAGIQAYGHKARIETADDGSPMISARGGDINYVVYFYGCDAGANCLDLQFLAAFDVTEPLTADFVNGWNRDWVMGKAFVDETGDPTITFVVAGSPSMPGPYFQSVMEVWTTAVDSFLEDINW